MKIIKLIALSILLAQTITAQQAATQADNQYAAIDKLALQIPDSSTTTSAGIASYISANFTKDIDKARAIFAWEAQNIEYDIDFLLAKRTFQNQEEKITQPLKTHKGICENYATLFTDVCTRVGIKSVVVEGYVRQPVTGDYLSHAWSASFIDNTWLLFDPTWGAGYLNDNKYYKRLNNDYFKVQPSELIKSHMPFDYLWQLLNYPITGQEFYDAKTQEDKSKPFYNYADSIAAYEKQSRIEKLTSSAYRIEKNGVKNPMTTEWLKNIKQEIQNYYQAQVMNMYNSVVADFNDAVSDLNEFIQYRNKQFTPPKTDAEIQAMIDVADTKAKAAESKLNAMKNTPMMMDPMVSQLNKLINDITVKVAEQQSWLKTYFSKSQAERKTMFYDKKVKKS